MAIIVLVLFVFVIYTVMIRPQQRRARDHQALIAAVEVGDEVMTTAGIFGTVTSLDGDILGIEIAPGTVMRVARAAIGRRILPDDYEESFDDDAAVEDDFAVEDKRALDEPTVVDEPRVIDEPQIIETPDDVATPGDSPGHESLGPESRPGNGDAAPGSSGPG